MRVSERVSAEEGEGENVRATVCVITLTDHSTYRQQILNKSYKINSLLLAFIFYFILFFQGRSQLVTHVWKLT